MRERIERAEADPSAKSAIRGFLHELIERSIHDRQRRGCLIVNSALEVSPHDVELRGVIASYLREIEMFFRRSLERGQQAGEIPRGIDAHDTARHFLGIVLGIRVRPSDRSARCWRAWYGRRSPFSTARSLRAHAGNDLFSKIDPVEPTRLPIRR